MWTDDEIKFLKLNFGMMRQQDIAERLKKGQQHISTKAKELGLKKQGREEFAVYYDDTFAYTGTKEAIMRELGTTESNFVFLTTPANAKRVERTGGIMIVKLGKWPENEAAYVREMEKLNLEGLA